MRLGLALTTVEVKIEEEGEIDAAEGVTNMAKIKKPFWPTFTLRHKGFPVNAME
jgi:hypothetical protein